MRIDWWGSAMLTVWITALVLMPSWGGSQYEWNSPLTIGPGAAAAAGLAAFLFIEHEAAEPVMPPRLFSSTNFSLANLLGFVVGFAMFGGITFLPQFQQYVQGQSLTSSGLLRLRRAGLVAHQGIGPGLAEPPPRRALVLRPRRRGTWGAATLSGPRIIASGRPLPSQAISRDACT